MIVRRVVALGVVLAVTSAVHAQAPPAPAESGTVSGRILDESTGEPLVEAGVEAVGSGVRVQTDIDGRYTMQLPPGTYELRVFAPLYQGMRLQGLLVRPDAVSTADAALKPTGQAGVQVVEVVAEARKATEAAQLVERKSAAVVKETISREAMTKSGGSDAADIVKRAPSVTIQDDKFVFVRGLGERYTSALLNDSRLPSPDPLRRVVPLDLFPVDFLESISVVKSYSPDLPGDFSGGLVLLSLRDFPEQPEYSLGISTGANSQTTGQDFLTYPGSPGDYFALGTRFRDTPATLPDPVPANPASRRFAIGRSFKDIWSPELSEAPPNFGANFSIGNSFGPFGFQFGGTYSSEFRMIRDQVLKQFSNAGTPENPEIDLSDDFRADIGTFQVKLGGVLTAAYKPSPNHKMGVRLFVNRNATDETEVDFGQSAAAGQIDSDPPEFSRQSSLRYVVDQLGFAQFAGEHDLGFLRTDWRTVLARTTRNEPDTRYINYEGLRGDLTFSTTSLGGQRFSNFTREDLSDSMLDFTVPFATGLPFTNVWSGLPAKFKFGPAYNFRKRTFEQRQFAFIPDPTTQNTRRPPEDLLTPDMIGPGLADFEERTDPEDTFEATQEIIGGYGLFELPLIKDRLRVIGGSRVEYSLIRLSTDVLNAREDPDDENNDGDLEFVCPTEDQTSCFKVFRKKNVDPLPAVNVVLSPRADMNLRFSWGKSVSRPEFRELAPVEFPAQRGRRARFGNPDLVEAHITSYDARWEWFFSPLELVSLSFFYKELQEPIEVVQVFRGADIAETWVNSESADLIGFEFEGRKNLGFASEWLRRVNLSTNVTYADSEAIIPQSEVFGLRTQQTDEKRRLVGQAPFIVNASIEYFNPELLTVRLLYLTAAASIASAGSAGLPNTIFERRDQLDAVVIVPLERFVGQPVNLRMTAENLLNAPYVFTVGGRLQEEYTSGVKVGLGLSYTF